jgi:subtilisin family serine protease
LLTHLVAIAGIHCSFVLSLQRQLKHATSPLQWIASRTTGCIERMDPMRREFTRLDVNSRMASGPPIPPPPIFTESGSDAIPGDVIVQVREGAAAQFTANILKGPSRGMAIGASGFGVPALDSALNRLPNVQITQLFPPASPLDGTASVAAAMGSTFRIRFGGNTSVNTVVERFTASNDVVYAEPNRYRESSQVIPNDPSFPSQWGLTRINCPTAWMRQTGSANVTVAVIDTGIDLNHPELAPLLIAGQDLVDLGTNPVPPAGFRFEGDFAGRDADPQDEVGHGTHVAGTISCMSNNGVGVAGVTWSSRLMPVRVLARIVNINDATDVRGVGSAADIAAGIRWAVDHGAQVLNLSLGGPTDTQVERDAIAYAVSRGVVVVAAMGNAFQQGNPTSFPAAYPDVIAVGAINQADQRAPFSQTGAHIDVAAPGVGILSTVWDDGFATFQGTSMASPHVAGVAALILACNGSLTAAQVGDIIRQTAQPLRDNPGDPVPNDNYGFGCVDAAAAIDRACPPRPSVPIIRCPSVVTVRCPSQTLRCPSVVTVCPSQQVRCPSVTTLCPSIATVCPSEQLRCPSVVTLCPSQQTRCPSELFRCPSEQIRCPSVTTLCPSEQIRCLSQGFNCPSESTICPSVNTLCPSESFRCPSEGFNCPSESFNCPSQAVACPSEVGGCPSLGFCGEPPIDPGRPGLGGSESGLMAADWAAYDPYSPWYGGNV